MAVTAEQLNIVLAARDREFKRAMDQNARRIERFSKRSQRRLGQTSRAFGALGAAAKRLAPLLAGAFTVSTINNLTRTAARIGELSDLAGTNVVEFQRFAAGAKTVGVEMEKAADIIKDVNDKVGDFIATGAGPMQDFFENVAPQVGVTAEQFARLSGPEALQLYVNSLERANLSQAEMTFYMEALANDATVLLPLLRNNGREMKNYADEAQRAGRIQSEETVDGARDLKNEMDELSQTISSQLTEAVIDNKDELLALVNFVTDTAIPAISSLINTISEGVRQYKVLRGIPYEGMPTADEPADAEGYENAAEGAAGLGGGDPSGTGQFYVDENGNVRSYGQDDVPTLPGITIPTSPPGGNSGSNGGTGGGSGGDALERLKRIKDEYRDLIGTLDRAAAAQHEFERAQKTVNAALDAGEINSIQAARAIEMARAQMEWAQIEAQGLADVMDTMQSSMEDAFMSIMDGTRSAEDAFKTMARSVISELYRVLVVQRLVGSFQTGTGILGAIGGAFGVPTAPGRAAGGAVQAGQPYTVGESGRELFVPSSAGRIMSAPQTKDIVQRGEDVIVQQTINVSTGVQQTVRSEIKSLMPAIAENAKSAVLDAKRRGGSYGGAF